MFKDFQIAFQSNLNKITKENHQLYVSEVSGNDLWDFYLDSFPDGSDPIYKENTTHNCNCCKSFIRNFGSTVYIQNGKIVSVWRIADLEYPYNKVAESMADVIEQMSIKDIFVTHDIKFGNRTTLSQNEDGTVQNWYHFEAILPKSYKSPKSVSLDSLKGSRRQTRDVFKRSMEELTLESGETILELIDQKSLYRGDEFKNNVKDFVKLKKQFAKLKEDKKEVWLWQNSIDNGAIRIRNSAIGTLLIDISEGMELDKAVTRFEKVMAPTNYKRPKAIFTKQMVKDAQNQLADLGFGSCLNRRFAKSSDLTVNNVLFVDRSVSLAGDVFDDLIKSAEKSKEFKKIEEISIDDFVEKVLPKSESIELMFENKHQSNLFSLIAPEDECPSMFKWNNNFSWTYNGNITDSMREMVVAAGGRVDGVFRFTMSWNHDGQNQSLMDLHVFLPSNKHSYKTNIHNNYGANNNRVGWNNRTHSRSGGRQDVDNTAPPGKNIPIENITFPNIRKMPDGIYQCKVHNWAARNPNTSGFKAEIECGGELLEYEYNSALKNHEWVTVAEVELKNGEFIVNNKLSSSAVSKNIWGIDTNNFVKVNMLLNSPNHWDGEETGNKHYFFVMDQCTNPDSPRGFFNEYLNESLTPHRKVFEALGSKLKVKDSAEQLSGLGFSSTKKDEVIVKVNGNFSRTLKIKF